MKAAAVVNAKARCRESRARRRAGNVLDMP
jgi:hypothetical protein